MKQDKISFTRLGHFRRCGGGSVEGLQEGGGGVWRCGQGHPLLHQGFAPVQRGHLEALCEVQEAGCGGNRHRRLVVLVVGVVQSTLHFFGSTLQFAFVVLIVVGSPVRLFFYLQKSCRRKVQSHYES